MQESLLPVASAFGYNDNNDEEVVVVDIFDDGYCNANNKTNTSNTNNLSSAVSSSFDAIVVRTCYTNRSTAMICLAGLITNVITAFSWGLVLLWAQHTVQLSKYRLATLGAAFTLTKASMMIVASMESDHYLATRRKPISGGVHHGVPRLARDRPGGYGHHDFLGGCRR